MVKMPVRSVNSSAVAGRRVRRQEPGACPASRGNQRVGYIMTTTHPDDDVLRGLLDSSLPEPVQVEVTSHLDSCSTCQNKLEQIASGGTSVLQLAKQANTTDEPSRTSAFWPAIERVRAKSAIVQRRHRRDPLGSRTPGGIPVATRFQLSRAVGRPAVSWADRSREIANWSAAAGWGWCFGHSTLVWNELSPSNCLIRNFAQLRGRDRFHREARAAARVTHENVVTIHHVGCIEDRDLSFLVMQFVRGRSLQERLDENGRTCCQFAKRCESVRRRRPDLRQHIRTT